MRKIASDPGIIMLVSVIAIEVRSIVRLRRILAQPKARLRVVA